MGFFSKETCSICGVQHRTLNTKIRDGIICSQCGLLMGFFSSNNLAKDLDKQTLEDMKIKYDEAVRNSEELKNFKATKVIGRYIEFDEINKRWFANDNILGDKTNPKILNFKDIFKYELIQDGIPVSYGGIAGPLIGGAAFGAAGAVIGSMVSSRTTVEKVKRLKVAINVNYLDNPLISINLIYPEAWSYSKEYKEALRYADEIMSTLSVIIAHNEASNYENTNSPTDELLKLKEMYDDGLITKEEFLEMKKEIF